MRDSTPRRWNRWRITRQPVAGRLTALRCHHAPAAPDPAGRDEQPGPDGIRHGLVAHVRQLIADGAYDTPERWEAAQERLFESALNGR